MSIASLYASVKDKGATPTEYPISEEVRVAFSAPLSVDIQQAFSAARLSIEAGVEIDQEFDVPTLSSQCRSLTDRVSLLNDLWKTLDAEQLAFAQRKNAISAELKWLHSAERGTSAERTSGALSAKRGALVARIADDDESSLSKLIATTGAYLSPEATSLRKDVEVNVIDSLATTDGIRSGGFFPIGEPEAPFYTDAIRRAVGTPIPGRGTLQSFYCHAAAHGRAWALGNEMGLQRAVREEQARALEDSTKVELHENDVAEFRDQEDRSRERFRAEELRDALDLIQQAEKCPGLDFPTRALALLVEILGCGARLICQSKVLSLRVSAQYNLEFSALSNDLLIREGLELGLAKFRDRLSALSVALDRCTQQSISGPLVLSLDFDDEDDVYVATGRLGVLPGVRSFINSISLFTKLGGVGVNVEVILTDRTRRTIRCWTMIHDSEGFSSALPSVQGKLLSGLELPIEVRCTSTKRPLPTGKATLVIGCEHRR